MKKVFFKISQNLQESICAGVFFPIKLQDGGLHLYQIETPVQVLSLYGEVRKIFQKTNFTNVYKGLLLKSKILVGVSFRRVSGFYYKQKRQLFYYEETGRKFLNF